MMWRVREQRALVGISAVVSLVLMMVIAFSSGCGKHNSYSVVMRGSAGDQRSILSDTMRVPSDVLLVVKWKCTPGGEDTLLTVVIGGKNPNSGIVLVNYPESSDRNGTATLQIEGDGGMVRHRITVESKNCDWRVRVIGRE